jgi:cell division septation protein DedD
MSTWKQLQEFGHKVRSQLRSNHPSNPIAPEVAEDEAHQLDLLLNEVRANEQQLGPQHWATLSAAFQERIENGRAHAEDSEKPRKARYRSFASHALPLGGLLAVAALSLLQLTPPNSLTNALSDEDSTLVAPPALAAEILASAAGAPASPPERAAVALAATLNAVASAAPRAAHQRANVSAPETTRSSRILAKEALVAASPMLAHAKAQSEPILMNQQLQTAVASDASEDSFAVQLAALKRADKALKSGNSTDARRSLAREFSPQLGLHARALRVILACQDGSVELGKRALAAQEAQFPNSPYLARMRRACGMRGAD